MQVATPTTSSVWTRRSRGSGRSAASSTSQVAKPRPSCPVRSTCRSARPSTTKTRITASVNRAGLERRRGIGSDSDRSSGGVRLPISTFVELNAVLARAVELGASDIHLKIGQPPIVRRDGELGVLPEHPPLTDLDLEAALAVVADLAPAKLHAFHETGELDIAYTANDLPRFRVNGFRQRGSISFAFRVIPKEVPSFEELRLPKGVGRLAEEHRGLVLVTGATGSGKTTTLAAVIDRINRTRRQHIVTIEDPIEIVHADRGCIVNQREVGIDTESYMEALRRVLRQDPDVILIGELRDEESAKAALQAAESGHLVLSTMHTIDAAETIGRLIEFFPPTKQLMIRQIIAGVLRGVISQRLLPRKDGGRIAAVEVMV